MLQGPLSPEFSPGEVGEHIPAGPLLDPPSPETPDLKNSQRGELSDEVVGQRHFLSSLQDQGVLAQFAPLYILLYLQMSEELFHVLAIRPWNRNVRKCQLYDISLC